MKKMTEGSPSKLIIMFAIPLLIGNIFQQLYSMADMYIVGHTIDVDALGAIGCTGSISWLLISFAQGLTSGFCVLISRHYGAGNDGKLRRSFVTGTLLSLLFIAILTTIGCILVDELLLLIKTKPELYDRALEYIRIIMAGLGATILYNFFGGVLRALGDSRTPLYVLIGSCVLNIALDYLFILGFGIGVRGAAFATVISQLSSAAVCLFFIMKQNKVLRIKLKEYKTTWNDAREHIAIGLPMGFQWALLSIGSLIMQTALNGLNVNSVTAFSAASKVDTLALMPSFSFGTSMSTYVAQNYGAGKLERIGKGMRRCCAMSLGLCALLGVMNACFGNVFAKLFVGDSEPEVITLIHTYLIINGSMYFVHALLMIYRNAVQALGRSFATMMAGFMELVMRFITAFVLVDSFGFTGACFSSPLAWLAAAAPLVISYHMTMRRLNNNEKNRNTGAEAGA